MQDIFLTNDAGKLLVRKEALIENGIYSEVSYRSGKSKKRFSETIFNENKYVLLESLPDPTKKTVICKLNKFNREYTQQLLAMEGLGLDTVPTAVEFTADILQLNEPFIRSSIQTYMNTHYTVYTRAYLDAGLNSRSVKGYAKQCALIEWICDFFDKITESEPNKKRCSLLLRSFRMNLLTAVSNIELEVRIPLSESRFNKWLDEIVSQMNRGKKPEDIIKIKRKGNSNREKVTEEQFDTAYYWYINGTNMSVATVYKKWIEHGKSSGWWTDKEGNFNPPTEGRLYQLLAPYKNAASLEKTDAVTYMLNKTPSVSRDLPEKKNHVWVIDGTAHNENADYKGDVKQYVYVIKVMDVATLRMAGVSPLIGVREPFANVKDAILMGIRETGYKPAIIHCDRGPAWKELERWCEENKIKLYPSRAGNARAKTIESCFNIFDNDITRFLKGYSGQNRTAGSINSRPSEKRETDGKRNARSTSIVMEWLRTEGVKAWNERIIETLEGKPCGKTPYELWDEKESFTPKLDYLNLCTLCGTLHRKKLTINGLDIEHNTRPYTYFPVIETPEQREKAARTFNEIPLDAKTSNQLQIYVLNGGEPAAVYDRFGKYLGIWKLKPRTGYIDENGNLAKFMALVHRVTELAKETNRSVKERISKRADFERIEISGNEMLTGKRRTYTGRYDKSALLEEEMEAKSKGFNLHESTPEYREYVDPDTGELLKVTINRH